MGERVRLGTALGSAVEYARFLTLSIAQTAPGLSTQC